MLHKTRVAIRFRAKKPSPQTTRNFALVCLWCGRTVGRSVYGHVIAKFSRMGSLPHLLTHDVPQRALRARELGYYHDILRFKNQNHCFLLERYIRKWSGGLGIHDLVRSQLNPCSCNWVAAFLFDRLTNELTSKEMYFLVCCRYVRFRFFMKWC